MLGLPIILSKIFFDFEYWNASGVLIIHAAIALADAITIKIGGVKCSGEDHHEVIGLINELITSTEEKKKALNQLDRIIDHKSAVSYRGDIYQSEDIELLWKYLDRFRRWAVSVLEE